MAMGDNSPGGSHGAGDGSNSGGNTGGGGGGRNDRRGDFDAGHQFDGFGEAQQEADNPGSTGKGGGAASAGYFKSPRNNRGGKADAITDAPLVRTPPSKRLVRSWKPPQYIPGIEHVVEGWGGVDQYAYQTKAGAGLQTTANFTTRLAELLTGQQIAIRPTGSTSGLNKEELAFNQAEADKYSAYSAKYKKKMDERALIPSLPDQDDLLVKERKDQARKRMRGVLGTMLTQQESAGKPEKQKLGARPPKKSGNISDTFWRGTDPRPSYNNMVK